MVIGNLSVILGLQSSSFDTKMQKSSTKVVTLRDRVQSTSSVLSKIPGVLKVVTVAVAAMAVAFAAAAYGGVRALATEMERIDKIGKTAQKLGMLPEALVGLQHGAALAGVDARKLDMGIQRMTRRMSEAAKGGGEAKDAIAELGLNANKLANMTPDQALMRVADAMAGVANQGDRVRLAFKLFDAEGVDLVRMMEGGSASIRKAMQDARELGLTFSRIDHQKVAMANDAMMQLSQSTGALKRQLATDFAPLFAVVAETITEGMVGATAAVNDHTRALASTGQTYGLVAESMFWFADALDQMATGVDVLNLKTMSMMVTTLKAAKATAEFLGQKDKADEYAAALDSMQRSMMQMGLKIGMDLAFDESLGDKMRSRYQEILDEVNKAQPKPVGDSLLDVGGIDKEAKRLDEITTPQASPQFSGGPKLIKRGTQADYASMDRWNASEKQKPLPGAELIGDRGDATAQELKQLNQKTDKVVDALGKIVGSTKQTSGNTEKTASAVERVETPQVVEM